MPELRTTIGDGRLLRFFTTMLLNPVRMRQWRAIEPRESATPGGLSNANKERPRLTAPEWPPQLPVPARKPLKNARQSSVDVNAGAGDVARRIRGQKCDDIGDFFRFSHAADGYSLAGFV